MATVSERWCFVIGIAVGMVLEMLVRLAVSL
jgi:hypothetical protein